MNVLQVDTQRALHASGAEGVLELSMRNIEKS